MPNDTSTSTISNEEFLRMVQAHRHHWATTPTRTIQAEPITRYGTNFRSKLEARWASVWKRLRLPWFYEPYCFDLPRAMYLPDFFLPTMVGINGGRGVYVEIKPTVEIADERARALAGELAAKTDTEVVIIVGTPIGTPFRRRDRHMVFDGEYAYEDIPLHRCGSCLVTGMGVGFMQDCEHCGLGSFSLGERGLNEALNKAGEMRLTR